jgi:diguanylate cyclase (GGDEF)-like protein
LCQGLSERGQLDAAVEQLNHLQRLLPGRASVPDSALLHALEARLAADLGRLDKASATLAELQDAEWPMEPRALMLSRIAVARMAGAVGCLAQAQAILREGLFQVRGLAETEANLALQAVLAEILSAAGDTVAAENMARETLAHPASERHPQWRLEALLAKAATHLVNGQGVAGQEAARAARELAEKSEARISLARAEILLGEAALCTGQAPARFHFYNAHAIADEVGHPWLKARALDGWGRSDPLADEAASRFSDAQRILQRLLAQLPAANRKHIECLPWVKALSERQWSGGGWLLIKPEVHQDTLERLGLLSAELSGLTNHYGFMIRAWTARRAQLSKLNELARTINESLSLEDVAENVLRVTLDLTGAERAFALLKSQGRYNDLIVRAGLSHTGTRIDEQPLSMSVCMRALQRCEPWAVVDGITSTEDEAGQSIAGLNLKTVMAAPLQSKGKPIGVLYVDSQAALKTYNMQDLEQLAALATHASCAIENALLYDTLIRHTAQLETQLDELRRAERYANLDALTGLRNRRAFQSQANREVALARRGGKPLSLILLDIDFFKNFNDTHGHPIGDHVLVSVAQRMSEVCREADLLARLGGEEFGVLCPETLPESALTLAERMAAAVRTMRLKTPGGEELPPLSLSGGVAGWSAQDATIDTVLTRADEALYAAKRGGRDRIGLAAPVVSSSG